ARMSLRGLEQQRDNAQREWQQVNSQLMTLQTQLSAHQARAEQAAQRSRRIDDDLAEAREQQAFLQEELEETRLQWQEANAAIEQY
ncbi:hypothetical protein, partial [Gilvimarinus sp. 1_MG-2023]|uniref:hypothetical protein n=1 Tax=Gilvimarinus sp. 1_MG-2023 TaxID=3062638 RepID=UPI0026E2D266